MVFSTPLRPPGEVSAPLERKQPLGGRNSFLPFVSSSLEDLNPETCHQHLQPHLRSYLVDHFNLREARGQLGVYGSKTADWAAQVIEKRVSERPPTIIPLLFGLCLIVWLPISAQMVWPDPRVRAMRDQRSVVESDTVLVRFTTTHGL